MSFCSPNKNGKVRKETCYDDDDIIAIAKAFNKYIKKNKICSVIESSKCIVSKEIDLNKTPIELLNSISSRLNKICKAEYCWTDLDFINKIPDDDLRDKIKNFTFKPKTPGNKKSWLNTENIEQVIHQYTELYYDNPKKFYFIGAQPSDLFNKINSFNLKKLENKDAIGIIFNTDPHNKPGTHWLAVYIDNKEKSIEYFDSLGNKPNKNISKFLNYFIKKGYSFQYNKIEHQKGNSNCGVYAIYFIIEKLKGFTFNEINARILTDTLMNDYRDIFFRPN